MKLRAVFTGSACALLLLAPAAGAAELRAPQGRAAAISPEVAQEWLRYGNERHMQGKYVHWHQSPERRREVAAVERPHTIVLSCSDSRVPPEILFDQGLGDIYVVRVAGNVAGDRELGSIEHAAQNLGAGLLVVLGHHNCSVVQAAVQGGGGGAASGHLGAILASLSPAVARAKGLPGNPLEQAARANVELTVEQLANSEPVLSRLVRNGKLKVAGALYNMESGLVEWLPESAKQQGAQQISALPH